MSSKSLKASSASPALRHALITTERQYRFGSMPRDSISRNTAMASPARCRAPSSWMVFVYAMRFGRPE